MVQASAYLSDPLSLMRCRVGGPVGENNFKFFIQFTGYTSLYCLHLLVVMAVYVHKQIVIEVSKKLLQIQKDQSILGKF